MDPAKAARNERDHGISFEMAREASVEIIHIISARKAVAYEQSIYEDQIN